MSFDAVAWCWSMTAWASAKDARAACKAARPEQVVVKPMVCPFTASRPHWHVVAYLPIVELEEIATAIRSGVTVPERVVETFVRSSTRAERTVTLSAPQRRAPTVRSARRRPGGSTRTLRFEVDAERVAELGSVARQAGFTRSALIQQIVEHALDARRPKGLHPQSDVKRYRSSRVMSKKRPVSFVFDEHLIPELDEAAREERRSRSSYLQVTVEKALDERRAKQEAA